jgi:acetyl-CoA synthetase
MLRKGGTIRALNKEILMDQNVSWAPSPESIRKSNLYALMQEKNAANYAEIHKWSVQNPEAFWEYTIRALDIKLRKPYTQLLDLSGGVAHPKWLRGAELNIAESCFNTSPDSPAIIVRHQNARLETITIGQLDRLSNRVANGLSALGISKGDAVAIDMTMTAESVAIYLGIVKAGAIVVSIPDSLPAEEIAKRLRIGNAKAVFTQDEIIRVGKSLPMYQKVRDANAPPVVVLSQKQDAPFDLRPGDVRWNSFLSANEQFHAVTCAPEDPINILFSSGTTGDPKAIPWDHTTPIKCASDGLYHQDIKPGDVVCWPTNLGWMMGPWLVFASLLNKSPMALYEGAPTERHFCEFVQDVKVTMLGLVPSIVKSWRSTGAAEGLDWSHIKTYSSSGEASNSDDYAWLMKLNQPDGTTRPIIEYCGGTEIGGGYATSTVIEPQRPSEFNAKAMGIDLVFLNEDRKPCLPGEAGEAFLRPPSIGLSTRLLNADNDAVYFANCPVIDDRPLRRHGDQMIVGEGGRFRSNGRADDAMNLGGIKIGSVELERALNNVAGIMETAAVAVPPPGGGPDRLVIFAVIKEECKTMRMDAVKSEMQQAIKDHVNPLFRIEDIVVVDSLPRTASNKVMRRILRSQYSDEPA